MRHRQRALLTVVAMAMVVWPVRAGQTVARTPATAADEARRRVDSFSVIDVPRIDALMTLAHQHRVPLGVEYAGPELFTAVTLNLDETDVGSVIRALFPAGLGFRVATDGPALVIRHRALPPPDRNALDLVLPQVVIPRAVSMQRAAWQVWITLALQLDPTIGGFASSELGLPEERVLPMELKRVSARDALGRIARAAGRAVWCVTVPPSGLGRRWKKDDPPMWSAMPYDDSRPESVGRLIAARMPDIAPRGLPTVGVIPFTPRKIRHVDPAYPTSATDVRTEQVVVVELRINEEGRVADARILRTVPAFDQAALAAVRQWQYEPLLTNGSPTAFTITVVVNFTPSSDGGRSPATLSSPVR